MAVLVQDLKDLRNDLCLDQLELFKKQWVVLENLLSFFVEEFLIEFSLVDVKHLCVLRDLQLPSQVLYYTLKQIKSIIVEIFDHSALMGSSVFLNNLHLVFLSRRVRQILPGQRANMRPKLYKGLVNLFDIGLLLLSGLVVHSAGGHYIHIDLVFQLVLNVHPEYHQ